MFWASCLLVFLTLFSCHPFSLFKPPALKTISSSKNGSAECLRDKTLIAVDKYGIPYIKAKGTAEAFYALGYMHARDRLFQLDVMRHAATGRVSELFGRRGLSFDRKLRILTYRLDEQLERLSNKEQKLLDNYVRGVNDGAKARGKTAEHFLLGIQFEEFKKREVLAIARLQTWYLGSDLFSEISRLKIARSDWPLDVKNQFIKGIDDEDSAILSDFKNVLSKKEELTLPNYVSRTTLKNDSLPPEEAFLKTGDGASNAWAIEGKLSADGNAILMNDPHLQHNWPSNFYLAALDTDEYFVTGATFVGLPAILIGATKSLAFGVTASFLNTQDAVLLTIDKNDPNYYLVGGQRIKLVDWPQEFCLNKKGHCLKESYQKSIFGPVVRHDFDQWIDQGDAFAVQWTGFSILEHTALSYQFIELAKAKEVKEAIEVIKTMTLPGVNMIVADNKGAIGYAYAGLIPKRDPLQNLYLPLDGRMHSSLWSGFLAKDEKPAKINPKSGYLITANQNIFSSNADASLYFGKNGAPPLRALRIKEQIENLRKKNKRLNFEDLSLLQLDDMSLEAKKMAPLLGALCVEHFKNADSYKKQFAEHITRFDGHYDKNSLGAFPYELLVQEIIARKLKNVFGNTIPEFTSYTGQTTYTLKHALIEDLLGKKSAIFKDNDKHLINEACEASYQNILKKANKNPSSWRFGKHHYLQRESILGKTPVLGAFFRDKKREVSGSANSPMAEAGLPVTSGANLRFRVKLTSPPKIYAVIDSGNSGDFADNNALSQATLWHEGKSIELETSFDNALKNSVSDFKLP